MVGRYRHQRAASRGSLSAAAAADCHVVVAGDTALQRLRRGSDIHPSPIRQQPVN